MDYDRVEELERIVMEQEQNIQSLNNSLKKLYDIVSIETEGYMKMYSHLLNYISNEELDDQLTHEVELMNIKIMSLVIEFEETE